MGSIANRRSVMTLYSGVDDIYSHQARIVLAEKGVNVDIVDVTPNNMPEDLLDVNPYNTVPTLVDRELVLYRSSIIMEYLDERFPHPPRMPVYPVMRAKSRLMMYRIEHDWYSLLPKIQQKDHAIIADQARKELSDSLVSIAAVFAESVYFLSDSLSLVDCCIAPLLWRLPMLGVELPARQTAPIKQYAERMFALESFQTSLSEIEREMLAV